MKLLITNLFILLVIGGTPIWPQDNPVSKEAWREAGLPYIQNFSPMDYGGEIQNFCAVQDKRGLMYFGNTLGVLVYDGVSWRLIQTPNQTVLRSLLLDDEKLFIGTIGDFGFVDLTAAQPLFTSLTDSITEQYRDVVCFVRRAETDTVAVL